MSDMSGFSPGAEMQEVIRQMAAGATPAYGPGVPVPGVTPGAPPPAAPTPPPGYIPPAPQGPTAWPTAGTPSAQIPDPRIPPPAGAPPQPLISPAPAMTPPPPPAAPDPYAAPAPPAPPGPQLLQLPDGSVIDAETLGQIAQLGSERLQQLSTIDHAFRARPDIQQAVEELVRGRGGLFPQAPPVGAPPPPAYPTAPPPAAPGWPAPGGPVPPVPPVGSPTGYPLPPTRTPAPTGFPPGLDLEDPTVQYAMAQRQEVERMLDEQRALLARQQQVTMQSSVSRARNDVREKYPNLTFDDWGRLEAYAAQMGYAVGKYQMSGDFYDAARFALETAAETIPDANIRARLSSRPMTEQQRQAVEAQRQAQLAAITGTGPAAPRTDVPATGAVQQMTPEQRINGMARELEAAAQGMTFT